jgi:hypothetical protein
MDAAMSDIDRNNTNRSSLDGRKPRRRQKSAASASTALTTNARLIGGRRGDATLKRMLQ